MSGQSRVYKREKARGTVNVISSTLDFDRLSST